MWPENGKQTQESFLDPDSAYEFKRLVETVGGSAARRVLAARHSAESSMPTLREFTERHLDTESGLLTGVEPGTRAGYRAMAEASFLRVLGDFPVNAIEKTDAGRWVALARAAAVAPTTGEVHRGEGASELPRPPVVDYGRGGDRQAPRRRPGKPGAAVEGAESRPCSSPRRVPHASSLLPPVLSAAVPARRGDRRCGGARRQATGRSRSSECRTGNPRRRLSHPGVSGEQIPWKDLSHGTSQQVSARAS